MGIDLSKQVPFPVLQSVIRPVSRGNPQSEPRLMDGFRQSVKKGRTRIQNQAKDGNLRKASLTARHLLFSNAAGMVAAHQALRRAGHKMECPPTVWQLAEMVRDPTINEDVMAIVAELVGEPVGQ